MITVFSIPKPFLGHIGTIQRNALASWARLGPDIRIVLFGKEEGVAEAASHINALHLPELGINSYGTPLISDAFSQIRTNSFSPYSIYSNADMLYNQSLIDGVKALSAVPKFLLCGHRWDVDILNDMTAASADEWNTLFTSCRTRGRLHGPAGIDYFGFRTAHDFKMPPFAVGRPAWDSWLVWKCRTEKVTVVDGTDDIRAIHQNHDYKHLKLGYQHNRGPERDLNIKAAGGLSRLLTLREADRRLTNGRIRKQQGIRRLTAALATSFVYRAPLTAKRWLMERLSK